MSSTCGKKKSQDGEHSRFVRQWLLNEETIALTFVKSNCLSMIMTRRWMKFWTIYLIGKTFTCIKPTITTCLSDEISGTVTFTPEIDRLCPSHIIITGLWTIICRD